MSSNSVRPVVFGLRLAIWYATLFVLGAIAILFLTYYVTAASLRSAISRSSSRSSASTRRSTGAAG